jgi:hypothetical protein
VVFKLAFCRLYVAAVFVVEFIREGVFNAAPFLVSAGGPLVPAGDEDYFRVLLYRVFPLLGEVVAVKRMVLLLVVLEAVLMRIGTSENVFAVHGGADYFGR